MSHTDEIEGAEDRGRRWYRLRPEPRRRTGPVPVVGVVT